MRLECYARTETGLVRPTNQDAVGCFPELGLFAVADGMGGHEAGEVASQMAVEGLHAYYSQCREAGRPVNLLGAVAHANERVYIAGHPRGRVAIRPMGTTVVAMSLALAERRVFWAHVGDSRLYRLRDGRLQLLTADHTRYGGRYSDRPEVPLDLPHTNELLAALGIELSVRAGSGQDAWQDGDVYLLCSDGISGLVPPAQLHAHLALPAPLDDIGARLVGKALEAGGTDNASLVLVRAET